MKKAALVILILIVAFAYNAGTFDHALVNVGLNRNDCARNGFGATFCGDELTQYQQRLNDSEKQSDQALQKLQDDAARAQQQAAADLRNYENCVSAGRTDCTYGSP